jgi:hypothetical protein
MWDMTDGSTNLPISIEKICTFGRMKRFRPVSAVVAALRESAFLEVTGPEGQEEVKRKVAYDPTFPRSKAESRSVYVKGFGDEEPSSQFDIEAFFAPHGPTNAVRLRRTPEKLFKGSVFVEFQDEETAQKFLALDPKPLWKGKHILKIQSKKEYTDQKEQDIKDGKAEPNETWGSSRGSFRGRGRGGNRGGRGDRDRGGRDRGDRDRGDRDPDDWKKRREEDRANGFKDRRGGDRRGNRDNKGGRGRRDDRGPRPSDRIRGREEKNGYAMIMLPVLIITNIKLVTSLSPKKRLNRSVLVTLMERMKSQQLRKLITNPKRTRRSVAVGMKTVRKIHQQSGSIPSLKSQLKSHDTPVQASGFPFSGLLFATSHALSWGWIIWRYLGWRIVTTCLHSCVSHFTELQSALGLL